MPRILEANRNENFHPEIYKEMGELGIFGASLKVMAALALGMFLMG